MASRNNLSQQNESEDSDDQDLLTLSNCITRNSEKTTDDSHSLHVPQDNTVEPDWVQEFSQSLPSEQQRRKVFTSQFDDDDDESIIDLVPDDPDLAPTQPSVLSDGNLQSQGYGEEKASLKRPRTSPAPRSGMPLVMSSKLDDSLVLLQSADQNLDLSGDVGAVGRVKVRNGLLHMDIKGTVYKAVTTACNSACVVSVGEDEAKVTAILDEALTLVIEQDHFASAEILVQGELSDEGEETEATKDTQPDGQSKSKRRKPSEKPERGKHRSALKAKSVLKNSRKKS